MTKEKKKKKKKLKWYFKLFIIIVGIIVYSFTLGTMGLFEKDIVIKSDKIDKNMKDFKIVQFSDMHYGSTFNKKELKKLIKEINKTDSDVVIFTGDLIDKRYKLTSKNKKYIISQLNNINASSKYFVLGEEDTEQAIQILNESGFKDVNKSMEYVYKGSIKPVSIIGKDIVDAYFKDEKNSSYFTILLLHNPNDIKDFMGYDFDITLAGHTHNGQINIYKLKELFISGNYYKPYEKLSNTKLYINGGLGTKKVNVRLFNHPTINLYRLASS